MEVLKLLLLCIPAAYMPAATSINHPPWNHHQSLYSHFHAHAQGRGSHMPRGFTGLQRHSESERISSSSSMDAYEKRDLHALLSFRNSITADPSGVLSNWTAHNSQNMCSWYGIRCRHKTRRVIHIDLSWYALPTGTQWFSGTLSVSLCNLSLLHTLNVSGHLLKGRIPPKIGQLKSLQVLDLSWTALNGSIPVELGLLQKLRALNLSANYELEGRIPCELGQLKALRVLALSWTALNGSIPVELGLLHKLRTLDLSENSLEGRIPCEFGQLKALRLLGYNQRMKGPILVEFKALRVLVLSESGFEGPIPTELGQFKELRVLDLRYSSFNGSIPADLGLLQKLEQLLLEGNEFSGNIPHQLGNLTKLKQLSIAGLNISGSIPPRIFTLPLSYLSLSLNLTTSLLKAIFNLTTLTDLSLYESGLTHIPVEIAKLTSLYLLGNDLTYIPECIAKLTRLTSLTIDSLTIYVKLFSI